MWPLSVNMLFQLLFRSHFPLLFLSQILFVLIDVNLKSNERVMDYFKLKKSQLPALAIFHVPDEKREVLTLDEISVDGVQDFCNRFLQRMQKVKRDSCAVYRELGSCKTVLLSTRLLKRMTLVLWTPLHPCHLLFCFHLHLKIRKALDLKQSRNGCLFLDTGFSSLTSALLSTAERFHWPLQLYEGLSEASIFREQQLGRQSEELFWALRMGVADGITWKRIRGTVSWRGRKSVKKATEQRIHKGSGLWQRSLLKEGQFNFHADSVLKVLSLTKLIFL